MEKIKEIPQEKGIVRLQHECGWQYDANEQFVPALKLRHESTCQHSRPLEGR